VSWFACEYLARSFGTTTLWALLDLLGTGEGDPAKVLHESLGLWPSALARRAGELIVTEYGAAAPPATPEVTPAA
jgi:hypothetical protein